jgi:hypothetical protein
VWGNNHDDNIVWGNLTPMLTGNSGKGGR